MKHLAAAQAPVVDALPTATSALAGSIMRLSTDNKAYWCTGAAWVELGGGQGVTASASAPTGVSGALWWNSTDGCLYIYFDDGNSSQWVAIGGPQGPAGGPAQQSVALLNFGTVPVYSKSFSWSDAAATTASKIMMTPSAAPASGRSADELEMDGFSCAAVCLANGTITAFVVANPGPVSGSYNFNYTLG